MNKRNVVSKYIYNFIFSLIFLLLCVWFLYFIEIYRYVMFVIQSQYKCKNTKNKHKSKMRINCSIWKNLKKKRKKITLVLLYGLRQQFLYYTSSHVWQLTAGYPFFLKCNKIKLVYRKKLWKYVRILIIIYTFMTTTIWVLFKRYMILFILQ